MGEFIAVFTTVIIFMAVYFTAVDITTKEYNREVSICANKNIPIKECAELYGWRLK